ncbi:Hypothetical_protein [Hexamita inflata]|uniref:Hypothetical_protein n=1 Tax=Hexamita inflata TaxID=28002 RepID=A0AA86QNJ0_9EUKA|nr:Hypothetical protein HINF_LOCUS45068 [Hexamita inflata]
MVIFITVTLAVFMERLKAIPKIITKINANTMLDLTTCQELDTLIIEDGTENNTDSSEEESCSSSDSSTSEHETESVEVTKIVEKNSIKQLIAILDDPRLKNEDIESAMIYLNKILECKDFLNPNPNRNSAGSEKRIQPFTEKFKNQQEK